MGCGASARSAVQRDWRELAHASDAAKSDEAIVLSAMAQDVSALEFASEDLRRNPTFMIIVLKETNDVFCLEYASKELAGNETFMLEAMQTDWRAVEYASETLKGNATFIQAAMQYSWYAYNYASDSLKGNGDFLLNTLRQASDKLKDQETFMQGAVSWDMNLLSFASDRLRGDETFMMRIMEFRTPENLMTGLQYVADKLKGNDAFMLQVLTWQADHLDDIRLLRDSSSDYLACEHLSALTYASDELKGNHTFMLAVLNLDWHTCEFASAGLRDSEIFMSEAVRKDWHAVEYASERLRGSETFMMEAIQLSLSALEYASYGLRSSEAFMLKAMQQELEESKSGCVGHDIRYLPMEVGATRKLVRPPGHREEDLQMIDDLSGIDPWWVDDPSGLAYLLSKNLDDRDETRCGPHFQELVFGTDTGDGWLRVRVRQVVGWHSLKWSSEELTSSEAFMMEAIQLNASALSYASKALKSSEAFMLNVLQFESKRGCNIFDVGRFPKKNSEDPGTLWFASEELTGSESFMLAAARLDPHALVFASEALKCSKEFMLAAVRQGETLAFASEDLRGCQAFMLEAAEQDWSALGYALDALKGSETFILTAMQTSRCCAVYYASDELKNSEPFMLQAARKLPFAQHFASAELRRSETFRLAVKQAQTQTPLGVGPESATRPMDFMDPAYLSGEFARARRRYERGDPDSAVRIVQPLFEMVIYTMDTWPDSAAQAVKDVLDEMRDSVFEWSSVEAMVYSPQDESWKPQDELWKRDSSTRDLSLELPDQAERGTKVVASR